MQFRCYYAKKKRNAYKKENLPEKNGTLLVPVEMFAEMKMISRDLSNLNIINDSNDSKNAEWTVGSEIISAFE